MKAITLSLVPVALLAAAIGCALESPDDELEFREAVDQQDYVVQHAGMLDEGPGPVVELLPGAIVGYGPHIYRVGGPAPELETLANLESIPFLQTGDNLLVHTAMGPVQSRLLGLDPEGEVIVVGASEDGTDAVADSMSSDAALYGVGVDPGGMYQDTQTCIWACEMEGHACVDGGGDKWCCAGQQTLCSGRCGLSLGATVPPGIGQQWAELCGGSDGVPGGPIGGGAGGGACQGSAVANNMSVTVELDDGTLMSCSYDGAIKQMEDGDGACVWVMDGGTLTNCTQLAPGSGGGGGAAQTEPAYF